MDGRVPQRQGDRDVLTAVGDEVLQCEDLEEVSPVDGQEHALGEMSADVILDLVRLRLEPTDFVDDLLLGAIIPLDNRREEWSQALDAGRHFFHVRRQRLKRALAEQCQQGFHGDS